MKNIKSILKTIVLLLLINSLSVFTAGAQDPPPPPAIHGSQQNEPPPGGGAPIGSGLLILTALGAAYGAKKLTGNLKKNREDLG